MAGGMRAYPDPGGFMDPSRRAWQLLLSGSRTSLSLDYDGYLSSYRLDFDCILLQKEISYITQF